MILNKGKLSEDTNSILSIVLPRHSCTMKMKLFKIK